MSTMTETLRTLFALDKNIELFVQYLPQMVIIFALISFGGWVYETIYCSVVEGEFTKRGFLFGPTCPIYGIGALAEWLVLGQISNPIIVFIIGAVLATVIEYSTGLFLERRFKRSGGTTPCLNSTCMVEFVPRPAQYLVRFLLPQFLC